MVKMQGAYDRLAGAATPLHCDSRSVFRGVNPCSHKKVERPIKVVVLLILLLVYKNRTRHNFAPPFTERNLTELYRTTSQLISL